MATLFEMAPEVKSLYDMLSNEEIDAKTFEDTFEGLGADQKLEGYVYVQKQLEADLEMFKKEKDRLKRRMLTINNNIEKIKKNVLEFMQFTGISSIDAGTFKVRIGKSEKVAITSLDDLPEKFLISQRPKIDIAGIRKELKSGQAVSGAALEENKFLVVR